MVLNNLDYSLLNIEFGTQFQNIKSSLLFDTVVVSNRNSAAWYYNSYINLSSELEVILDRA